MKPLFTVHAGEYLVGSFIEQHFKRVNVWLPSRDTGIDLLVTDRRNRRAVSLQVKFSKDFLVTHKGPALQRQLRATGWYTINRDKLRRSAADLWVFALLGFASRTVDYVVLPRRDLLRRLVAIHGRGKTIQSYVCVTETGRCWETRGLNKASEFLVANDEFRDRARDLTGWLNNWEPVQRLNR